MHTNAKQITYTDVHPGNYVRIIHYVRVLTVTPPTPKCPDPILRVEDAHNLQTFHVQGAELIARLASTDYFHTEKSVSQTELAERLISAGSFPFTVVFRKANGELRTLRGYFETHEALFGRSRVIDLDVPRNASGPETRHRLVDHREIQALTIAGVHYTLKGSTSTRQPKG